MAFLTLQLNTTYFGQRCINRWTYEASGTPASSTFSEKLVEAVGGNENTDTFTTGTLLKAIQTMVNQSFLFNSISAENIYDLTDFWATPFPAVPAGDQPLLGDSPAATFGFRTNLVRRDIRRATKRFSGITTAGLTAGGNFAAGTMTNMQAVADIMGDVLTIDDSGNTLTFQPVVLGKDKYTTPSGKTAYRFYPTQAEQADWVAGGIFWEPYATVRTQRSRQYGVGQ